MLQWHSQLRLGAWHCVYQGGRSCLVWSGGYHVWRRAFALGPKCVCLGNCRRNPIGFLVTAHQHAGCTSRDEAILSLGKVGAFGLVRLSTAHGWRWGSVCTCQQSSSPGGIGQAAHRKLKLTALLSTGHVCAPAPPTLEQAALEHYERHIDH
jgi:hypothetical protein